MALEVPVQELSDKGLELNYTNIPPEGIKFKNDDYVIAHIITPTGPTFSERFNTSLTWNDYDSEVWEEGTTITIDSNLIFDRDLSVEDRKIILRQYKIKFAGPFDGKVHEDDDGYLVLNSNQTDTDIAIIKI